MLAAGCGDDSSNHGPWVVQESPVARCGPGNTDFENARWEHDSESSRLLLTKAEGCAVYRAKLAFGRTWTTSTEICNRCDQPRYLNWSAPSTGDIHGIGLGEGVDIDGYKGPDHGDGLSGFVLFTDRNGRQMLNQCQVPIPMVWGTYEVYGINVRQILTVQLEPGFIYSSSYSALHLASVSLRRYASGSRFPSCQLRGPWKRRQVASNSSRTGMGRPTHSRSRLRRLHAARIHERVTFGPATVDGLDIPTEPSRKNR